MSLLESLFNVKKPINGMLHLPPTDGYSGFPGLDEFVEFAVEEAIALEQGGVHAILIENDNDHPHTVLIKPKQISSFFTAAKEISKAVSVPIGFDVLLNDWQAALDLAKENDGVFIRIDVFVDRVDSPAGHIEPEAPQIMAHRKYIDAEHIAVFADIQPKHKTLLEEGKPLTRSAQQAIEAGADALVVSGEQTGMETALSDIEQVKQMFPETPLIIGSGLNAENIQDQLREADGAIVGTSLKNANERIDIEKVKQLVSLRPV